MQERESQQDESQNFIYSVPSDFPTFLPHPHCWKWVSMSISHSMRGKYTGHETMAGVGKNISDTAQYRVFILCKDSVLQAT